MPAIRGSDNTNRKTRRRTRDLDQIHADLASKHHLHQYLHTKAPEDLPAYGQFYCVPCAKWFESELNYAKHESAKPHKRRLKQLADQPYSQKEAEAAVGLGADAGAGGRKGDEEVEMVEAADEK